MKYCTSCGAQVPENMKFCPSCGAPVNDAETTEQNTQPNTNPQPSNTSRPTVQKRNIVTCIILSLVTCGIYGIIWYYNAGKRMNIAGTKYNLAISDNSVMYLVLSLIGLGIVNYCLIQSDLNKYAQ